MITLTDHFNGHLYVYVYCAPCDRWGQFSGIQTHTSEISLLSKLAAEH